MHSQSVYSGQEYLRYLDLDYQARLGASSNPVEAAAIACQIQDLKMLNSSLRAIVNTAPDASFQEMQKTFELLSIVEKITDPKEQSKCAKKIAKRTNSEEVRVVISRRFSMQKAEERDQRKNNADGANVQAVQEHLLHGRFSEAIRILCDLQSSDGRREVPKLIAKQLPADFQMPKGDPNQPQLVLQEFTASLENLEKLEPAKITEVLKKGRLFITRLAAYGLPELALETAKAFQKHIRSDTIENALDRAAFITILYNETMALEMRNLIAIPSRLKKLDAGMQQIKEAKAK